jgi:hypothetical protein
MGPILVIREVKADMILRLLWYTEHCSKKKASANSRQNVIGTKVDN